MTYHRVSYYSNTTGATSGTGTTFPSGSPEFTSVYLVGLLFLNL
jgi:hypothetical protein